MKTLDELLLRRAQRGDPDAFEQLLTPLENKIWRVCWHYTGDEIDDGETRIKMKKPVGTAAVDAAPIAAAIPAAAPAADAPEEHAVAADEHRQLRECIARLPEDQREALVMTQLEGIPYEVTAKRLGVTEGTVKSRVNRAKTKLKEWLSENGELSPGNNVKQSGDRKKGGIGREPGTEG